MVLSGSEFLECDGFFYEIREISGKCMSKRCWLNCKHFRPRYLASFWISALKESVLPIRGSRAGKCVFILDESIADFRDDVLLTEVVQTKVEVRTDLRRVKFCRTLTPLVTAQPTKYRNSNSALVVAI